MYDDARSRHYLVEGLYQQLPLVNSWQGVQLLLSSENQSLTLNVVQFVHSRSKHMIAIAITSLTLMDNNKAKEY